MCYVKKIIGFERDENGRWIVQDIIVKGATIDSWMAKCQKGIKDLERISIFQEINL